MFFPEDEAYTRNMRAFSILDEPKPNDIQELVSGPMNEKNMSLLSLAMLRVRASFLSLATKRSCPVLPLAAKDVAARQNTAFVFG